MSGFGGFWRGAAGEGGQAIVLIAAVLLGMLMAVGLAIDAGELYSARRTAQEAADSGAYAGAVVLYQSGDLSTTGQTNAANAATADVTRNGFTGDCLTGGATKVCVSAPPADGPHAADPHYVEVQITLQVKTSIVPSSGLTAVHVRAVAGAVPLNSAYALMALDKGSLTDALQVGSSGTVAIDGGGILVNSTSSQAAYDQGTANVTISNSTSGTQVAGNALGPWPSLTTGAPQRPDPFAGYPKPSVSGLQTYSALPAPVNNVITIDPGIWTVAITASGGTTIHMNTGTYITEAGINGTGNADLESDAAGVFIFNTFSDYPDHTTGTCQSVKLAGTATTTLYPLASGPYAGLLFYQDPGCTANFSISGTSVLTVTGTIYAPTAQVILNGNTATLQGSQVVADSINVQSGQVKIDFSAGSVANPVLPRLAE